jgi:hypothetical protein
MGLPAGLSYEQTDLLVNGVEGKLVTLIPYDDWMQMSEDQKSALCAPLLGSVTMYLRNCGMPLI